MTLHLQMPSQVNNMSPRILVVGVGGAGGNIINSMKESGVEGVEFLNVNTDSPAFKNYEQTQILNFRQINHFKLNSKSNLEFGLDAELTEHHYDYSRNISENNPFIEKITFEFIKLEISNLFITKKENNIDKVQIIKFKNSLINPLCKPINEVIESKTKIIQSI